MGNNESKEDALAAIANFEEEQNKWILDHAQESADALSATVTDLPHAVLPIALFEEHFLKFFTGEWTEEELQERNTKNNWLSLTSSSRQPVDLINEKGEVLFTVPSFQSGLSVGQIMNVSGDEDRMLQRTFDLASLKNNNLEGSGRVHFSQLAQDMLRNVFNRDHDQEEIKAWVDIYNHFGVFDKKETSTTGKAVPMEEDPEDLFDL